MSLKFFHIFFISLSTVLSLWFGIWCLRVHYQAGGSLGYLLAAIASFVAGALLVYYGNKFFKKMRKL